MDVTHEAIIICSFWGGGGGVGFSSRNHDSGFDHAIQVEGFL